VYRPPQVLSFTFRSKLSERRSNTRASWHPLLSKYPWKGANIHALYADLLVGLESATGPDKPIVFCNGTFVFPDEVDLTDTSVVIKCPSKSCILDGKGASKLFCAGRGSGHLSDHILEFHNLTFCNGKGTPVSYTVYY